jgi:hypothetical protein
MPKEMPWQALVQKKINAAKRAESRAIELRAQATAIETRQRDRQETDRQ